MNTSNHGIARPIAVLCAISSVAGACTESSTGTEQQAAPTLETAVANSQELAANVQTTAADYGSTMMASSTTADTCKPIHDQYDMHVRPWVSQILQTSGSMDSYIGQHGGGRSADDVCAAASMMDELDYHRSVACTFSDLAGSRAEAARHVNAMKSLASNVSTRCGEVTVALGGASSNWSPAMQGCQNWDGRCSAMMHAACCSNAMHDSCHQWCSDAGCSDTRANAGMGHMSDGRHQDFVNHMNSGAAGYTSDDQIHHGM